jgi:protein TonB
MAGLGGDIAYGPAPRRTRPLHQRCAAGLLTGLLYAGLVLVFIRGTVIHAVRAPQRDALVRLDKDTPKPPPVLPFRVQQIKPAPVDAAPPQFSIAPDPSPTAPPAATAPPQPAPTPSSGTAQTAAAYIDPEYLKLISIHIQHYYLYPTRAAGHDWEGKVVVQFTIDKGGTLLASAVARTSGLSVLDDEALAMVRQASPLPPIPDRMHMNQMNAVVPICFRAQQGVTSMSFGRSGFNALPGTGGNGACP